ncbi:hypothetical protein Ancab_031654 [Ancistrocladus abbreviatus]
MLSDVLVLVLGLSSKDVFRHFSFDSICRFSLGLDPECLNISMPISKFTTYFDLASKLSAERAMNVSPLVWKLKRIFNIGSEKELKQAIKIVNLLAKEVILQRQKVGFSTQKDLLSRFMLKVRRNLLKRHHRQLPLSRSRHSCRCPHWILLARRKPPNCRGDYFG